MATAASGTTDWTICPICLDVFDNTKSLPCLHGFCLKCLERQFKNYYCPGDEVPCPLCSKQFKVPPDGFVGLQHHFFIQHLVDTKNAFSKSAAEAPCAACLEESEGNESDIPAATVYCVDCNEKLCEKCSRHHRRPSMKGGPHQVRPLGAELEQELIQLRGSNCDKHTDKQVELYCHECQENICMMCFAANHRNHESGEISAIAETFRATIDDDDKQVLSGIRSLRRHSDTVKQDVLKFHNTVIENMRKDILDAGEAIKHVVDEQVNECLQELECVQEDGDKQAETIQEQLQLALVAMESFHTYSRELLFKGRPSDITLSASELHERATELLNNDITSNQNWPPNVTFTPADVTELTYQSLIGEISTSRSKNKTVDDVASDLPHSAAEGRRMIFGVTFLDSLLFVLRCKSAEQIEVYDTDSYTLQRHYTVPGLHWMTDMIACAHNRCLYVSGYTSKCMHRVGLLPNAGTIKWPVGYVANSLSLTDTHSVLVSCQDVRKVKEFSYEGKLLREVQLAHDIISPWHTIQLSNGQFILCHGDIHSPVHRVSLVGSDGRVVKSYGGLKVSSSQQIKGAFHLAVDRNGSVFVIDFKHRRVLLLSSELTYVREVLSRHQLKGSPRRLSLNADKRLLYVSVSVTKDGKWTGGEIVVVHV